MLKPFIEDNDYGYIERLLTSEEKCLCVQYGLVLLSQQADSYKKLKDIMTEQIASAKKRRELC